MNLEALPNELLLLVFSYLDGCDLLQGFYNLNSHFNQLLYQQFRNYQFKFDSISKAQFDWICQQHLPNIIDRTIYLALNEWAGSPGLIQLFFSYFPSINHFIRLEYLKISLINSSQILIIITHALPYLSRLIYLNLSANPSCPQDKIDRKLLLNNVWNLPRLRSCHLNCRNLDDSYTFSMTTQSVSIRYLDLSGFQLEYDDIYTLLNHTPNLKHMNVHIFVSRRTDNYTPSVVSSNKLSSLKISICLREDYSLLFLLLKTLPNLRQLRIRIDSIQLNGYQLEQFIRNYLPNLKKFTFIIDKFLYDLAPDFQTTIEQLFASFQTPFWIDEHQWYVRCVKYDTYLYLYTLPSNMGNNRSELPDLWYSTKPNDRLEDFHTNISQIDCNKLFKRSLSSSLRLSQIENLSTRLPLHEQFWSIIPNLDKLSSLGLILDATASASYMQTLFDCAPHVRSLSIQSLNMPIFTCTQSSIYILSFKNYRFCAEDCLKLAQSSLGQQCQRLLIELEHQQDILILIENMPNLRTLKVKFDESQDKNEILQWLQHRLSKTIYVSLVSNLMNKMATIQIWIR